MKFGTYDNMLVIGANLVSLYALERCLEVLVHFLDISWLSCQILVLR